jgi:hypothetical protein
LSSPRRPAAVTWLSLGLLALGLVYLIRMAGGLTAPELQLSVPHWYPPLTGAVWGGAWCVCAAASFTGRRWGPRSIAVIGVAFLAWYWFDRLAFVRSAYALRTMPFSLAVTALGALLVIAVLRQAAVRAYFGKPGHE